MSKINVNSTGINEGGINVQGDTKRNTKITISIGSVVIIAIAIFIFIISSNNIENQIIGTWNSDEISDLYLVFSDNNSLIVNRSGMDINGKYIFVDKNTIQLNFNVFFTDYVITADISIKNKTMQFNNIDDNTEYFFTSDYTTFSKVK